MALPGSVRQCPVLRGPAHLPGRIWSVRLEQRRVRIPLAHRAQAGGKALAQCDTRFHSDGSSSTFRVYFDHPVQIEADTYYTASAVLEGSELSYFGQEGMSEVSVGSVTFQFQSSSDSTNGTGVQGGQIPELIFYGAANPPEHAS
ncbi:hypothetical protein MRX96_046814 [Rhipicephalus microplus]